ncbi:MAG TPA: hypothetical protein VFZ98_10270 [Vicinamibacterales bacterium]
MRMRVCTVSLWLFACLLAAVPASAQYGGRRPHSDIATGESYHIEVAGTLWDPSPDIVLSSESLGIIGDQVDFVNTLGIAKSTFKQLKLVARPAKKHKFRFEFTPIRYTSQATIQTTFVFNGQRYSIGLPVTTDLKWNAYRFTYEWDFVYTNRGFAGLVLDAKYTDVTATLSSSVAGSNGVEFTHARAPIPAIGGIGRVYVVPNISITGEFTAFKLPDKALNSTDYSGRYYDFDLYGTINFNNYVGAQIGYRSMDVFYKVKLDNGTMTLRGLYFGGVGRF